MHLASPGPADTIGPLVGRYFLELAVYGRDEGAEVFVAEGAGEENAAWVRPTGLGEFAYEWQEVGYVGRDEHPLFGDGEFQHIFVFETFEILLGVEGPDVVPTIPKCPPDRSAREVGVQKQAGQYSIAWMFRFG